MQLKYSNYVAFSHDHGFAVNNSGLNILFKQLQVLSSITCFLSFASAGVLMAKRESGAIPGQSCYCVRAVLFHIHCIVA